MNRYILTFIVFLSHLYYLCAQGLNRDYYTLGQAHCVEHLTPAQLKYSLLTPDLAKFIPAFDERCVYECDMETGKKYHCPNASIYEGYVDFGFLKYSLHLKRHLEYCQRNTQCLCYWPEHSSEAAYISNWAYRMFEDLIYTTALVELTYEYDEQLKFISTNKDFFTEHGLIIAFIAKQLHFIDYYNVCRDIENYALSRYSEKEAAKIKNKLDGILRFLYPLFLSLNKTCYQKHPNPDIYQEILLMNLFVNSFSGLKKNGDQFVPSQ